MRRLAAGAALGLCVWLGSGAQGAVPFASREHPGRLAFNQDPETWYVRPGDSAQMVFADEETSDPANLHPWQDEYCNGRWISLAPDNITTADLMAEDGGLSSGNQYWARMESWMGSLTYSGVVPLWMVDDRFLELYESEPMLAEKLTTHIQRMAGYGINYPALVMDVTARQADGVRFLRDVKNQGFPGTVGFWMREGAVAEVRGTGWDFVVCDEEVVPVHYRGQAAPAWVRSVAGDRPVVLSPVEYDFQRDVIWLAAGAAGIWYRPLPPVGTAANEAAAIHLRASSAFLNRFRGQSVPLSANYGPGLVNFTLEQQDGQWVAVIPARAAAFKVAAPAGLGGRLVGQNWYNPATDQTIIWPLSVLPEEIEVKAPDANLWMYSIQAAAPGAESYTTMTAIVDWPE